MLLAFALLVPIVLAATSWASVFIKPLRSAVKPVLVILAFFFLLTFILTLYYPSSFCYGSPETILIYKSEYLVLNAPFYLFVLFLSIRDKSTSDSFLLSMSLFFLIVFFLNILISSRDLYCIFFASESFTILVLLLLLLAGSLSSDYTYHKALVQYFIFNAIISSSMFFVISFIYYYYGTSFLPSLQYYLFLKSSPVELFLNFFYIIFFFKLSFFPYYFVYVDLYDRLSWPVFGFLNYVTKLFLFFFFSNYFMLFFPQLHLSYIFVFFILTLLIGALGVLYSREYRRLLFYSSLFNLSVSSLLLFCHSYAVSLLYFYVYSFLSLFLVSIFIWTEQLIQRRIVKVDDLCLFSHFPLVFVLCIVLFTLSGIPPFIFFWFKFGIFYLIWSYFHAYVLIFMLLTSAIITIAYFKVIKFLIYDSYYKSSGFNYTPFWLLPVHVLIFYVLDFNEVFDLFNSLFF